MKLFLLSYSNYIFKARMTKNLIYNQSYVLETRYYITFCVLARRTTPLLEYIKNRKLEKQVCLCFGLSPKLCALSSF